MAPSARTAVDLAVPFSPRTSTPPTRGSTALRSRAVLSVSCPTIAEKGKACEGRRGTLVTLSPLEGSAVLGQTLVFVRARLDIHTVHAGVFGERRHGRIDHDNGFGHYILGNGGD